MSPVVLFLDTNFVFGILGLSDNPLVEVSQELLQDTQRNRLPFELRVHEETLRELRRTLDYFGDRLRSRRWTPALSRAALALGAVNGIERRYHERNAERALEVDTFLVGGWSGGGSRRLKRAGVGDVGEERGQLGRWGAA